MYHCSHGFRCLMVLWTINPSPDMPKKKTTCAYSCWTQDSRTVATTADGQNPAYP